MGATRANEGEREFGTVAESNWIVHDPGTFRKHYSQVHVTDMKKASMQVSALLCNLLQTSQVPPLGERKCSDTAVINADSQVAGANMVQLEHLKALLSSLDPIILKQLLVEILKE